MNFYAKDYTKYGFDLKQAKAIGDQIGINWDDFDLGEFAQGIKEELEHGDAMGFGDATNVTKDDLVMTARIALAHLHELPNYYTLLEDMEGRGEAFWEQHNRQDWIAQNRADNQAVWNTLAD